LTREVVVPYADNEGVKIYWRRTGSGEPLLLIMGLGYTSDMWYHLEPGLAAHHDVIMFDNRGIGRSDMAPGPHLIGTMAADAAAVLDAAGVDTAHVYGVSMGGYIAQEFALSYPDRVRRLVLGSTACGGEHTVPAAQEVLDLLRARERMTPEEGIRCLVPYIYDPSTPLERVESDLEIRLRTYPAVETYSAQLDGIFQWESYGRLENIRVPTLVMHGERDQLVPPANGRMLAEMISGAELVTFPNGSHILFTDRPEETVSTVVAFLAAPRDET
jgi:pimeloyl-ACP methyl ester carboxylesterase